jgi:hypothetical protein
MESLLLILIVFGDSGTEPLAKDVAAEFARLGGEKVRVLVGNDAKAQIESRDVKIADLTASSNIGAHLTASDKNLIIIHLERTVTAGDIVVDSRIWLEGRADRHVAIGGNGVEPVSGAVNGILPVIMHRMPEQARAGVVQNGDESRLAKLAEASEWSEIVGELAGVKQLTPRQYYYQILAFSRLGQRDPAVEALNHMREAHPKHFLIAAAEELIPPKHMEELPSDDDGTNTLRDPAAVGVPDDGGNTLK